MASKWKWIFFLLIVGGMVTVSVQIHRFWKISSSFADMGEPTLPHDKGPEAIVVLTGDKRRIPVAIRLLHERDSLLIISGVNPGISLAELINQQGESATHIHRIWEKIILETTSSSTLENAKETSKILTAKKIKQVILVTSEYHMHRALSIFRAVMPELTYYPSPVKSDFSSIGLSLNTEAYTGLYKFFLEYWKFQLYSLGLYSRP